MDDTLLELEFDEVVEVVEEELAETLALSRLFHIAKAAPVLPLVPDGGWGIGFWLLVGDITSALVLRRMERELDCLLSLDGDRKADEKPLSCCSLQGEFWSAVVYILQG